MKDNEVMIGEEEATGIRIEAHEMIQELTSKVSQLTLDGIMKDVIIRKLEEQIQKSN
jgi:hypothetical protein